MKYLFGLVGLLCLIGSLGTCISVSASPNAGIAGIVGSGIASIMFLIGVVALGVAALLEELQAIRKSLRGPEPSRKKLEITQPHA